MSLPTFSNESFKNTFKHIGLVRTDTDLGGLYTSIYQGGEYGQQLTQEATQFVNSVLPSNYGHAKQQLEPLMTHFATVIKKLGDGSIAESDVNTLITQMRGLNAEYETITFSLTRIQNYTSEIEHASGRTAFVADDIFHEIAATPTEVSNEIGQLILDLTAVTNNMVNSICSINGALQDPTAYTSKNTLNAQWSDWSDQVAPALEAINSSIDANRGYLSGDHYFDGLPTIDSTTPMTISFMDGDDEYFLSGHKNSSEDFASVKLIKGVDSNYEQSWILSRIAYGCFHIYSTNSYSQRILDTDGTNPYESSDPRMPLLVVRKVTDRDRNKDVTGNGVTEHVLSDDFNFRFVVVEDGSLRMIRHSVDINNSKQRVFRRRHNDDDTATKAAGYAWVQFDTADNDAQQVVLLKRV